MRRVPTPQIGSPAWQHLNDHYGRGDHAAIKSGVHTVRESARNVVTTFGSLIEEVS